MYGHGNLLGLNDGNICFLNCLCYKYILLHLISTLRPSHSETGQVLNSTNKRGVLLFNLGVQ